MANHLEINQDSSNEHKMDETDRIFCTNTQVLDKVQYLQTNASKTTYDFTQCKFYVGTRETSKGKNDGLVFEGIQFDLKKK